MNPKSFWSIALVLVGFLANVSAAPLALHPENPHYFKFKGRPTLLITSGEHYGAVVNLGFDYVKYLDTLAADKLNLTRTFLAYREQPGAFNIAGNSLSPNQEQFITPWIRSTTAGYFDGGNKFDLTQWNELYFARLRDFVRHASKRGIVVEANLFSCFYNEKSWNTHPFNARNNINEVGNGTWDQALTLQEPGLMQFQEAYVRKVVHELKGFDNVFYEICNEPYIGGVTREWQDRIAQVITESQKGWKHPFLIAENVANGYQKVALPNPMVSIFNFHYATPPVTVGMNYDLNKVIGDNETGFRGTNDAVYRMEGWDFLMAGGGLYNNLDYSFTAGFEDGTFAYPSTQPGGGSVRLRRQLRILHEFFDKFDFLHSKPSNDLLATPLPGNYSLRCLATLKESYALYLRQSTPNAYSVRWTGSLEAPKTGNYSLHTFSNDGVRLWLDGKQVINNWTDHGETEDIGQVHLEAGKKYDLKLEYFYNGGQSIMKLLWQGPELPKSMIPAKAFGSGLNADYFEGRDLGIPWRSRVDTQINFAWGTGFPFPVEEAGAMKSLVLKLPAGKYTVTFTDPTSGNVTKSHNQKTDDQKLTLNLPVFLEDIAIQVNKNESR